MAWSVESRIPFCTIAWWSLRSGFQSSTSFCAGQTKAVLRAGLRGIVPDAVLDRRDKMGFVTPRSRWMNGALGEHIEAVCLDSASTLDRWVDLRAALHVWRTASPSGREIGQSLVFRLGTLAHWLNRFKVSAS